MSIGKNPFDPAMEHGSGQHSEASPHRRAHSKRRQYAGLTSPPQGRNLAKVFRSAAVMERNPFSFKMRSQALTVKGCPTSARVSTNGRAPSVFLKETDVFLGMGFEITDGMLKNLFPTRLQKPVLCKRSASQSKNILVGGFRAHSRISPRNASPPRSPPAEQRERKPSLPHRFRATPGSWPIPAKQKIPSPAWSGIYSTQRVIGMTFSKRASQHPRPTSTYGPPPARSRQPHR